MDRRTNDFKTNILAGYPAGMMAFPRPHRWSTLPSFFPIYIPMPLPETLSNGVELHRNGRES